MTDWSPCRPIFAAILFLSLLVGSATAQDKPVDWVRGPAGVDVGEDIAGVQLPEHLVFAGQRDTKKLLETMGNPTNGSELGLVTSDVDGENWFVIFEWDDIGFVKDDERNTIDADALLESITKGTEAANKKRPKDQSALHVVGWAEPPHYDQASHNLSWAIRGRSDDGHEVINYNIRLLGREGVMSVTLVDDPAGIEAAKPRLDAIVHAFSFKQGKTYAEWVPGDKVATYGLTALVAAGAGAAAVKTGLLATLGGVLVKAWKAIAVGAVALLAGLARAVKSIFSRKTPAD